MLGQIEKATRSSLEDELGLKKLRVRPSSRYYFEDLGKSYCKFCGKWKDVLEFYIHSGTGCISTQCSSCIRTKGWEGVVPESADYYKLRLIYGEYCNDCGIHESSTYHGKLCVDHDHSTGEIRGLVCIGCNRKRGK